MGCQRYEIGTFHCYVLCEVANILDFVHRFRVSIFRVFEARELPIIVSGVEKPLHRDWSRIISNSIKSFEANDKFSCTAETKAMIVIITAWKFALNNGTISDGTRFNPDADLEIEATNI